MTPENAAAPLVRDADKLLACIHCGFCLHACPTFTRLGLEGDSPRGRLDLMRAVVEGRLAPDSEAFTVHIDRCLGCRACETACPAGVQYGFLLERSRETIARARGHRLATRLLLGVWGSRVLSRLANAGGQLLRATGLLPSLVRWLPPRLAHARFALAMLGATRPWPGLRSAGKATRPRRRRRGRIPFRTLATVASVPAERWVAEHPVLATGVRTGPNLPLEALPADHGTHSGGEWTAAGSAAARRVALLSGCVQAGLFRRVNHATGRVLAANGCAVRAAPGQACCGALHAHSGELERARALARANIDAFGRAGVDLVVVNAAGCGAMMKDYGELLKDDAAYAERARAFGTRVRDLSELLAELGPRAGAPLPLRVGYDAPCHLYHAQRITRAPLEVLGCIPGLTAVPLPDMEDCCGGAGIYGLEHPELAGRILADKLEAVRAVGPDVVVTPNPGCIMQIGAGLLLGGDPTPVLHPVELLDESYRRAGLYREGA